MGIDAKEPQCLEQPRRPVARAAGELALAHRQRILGVVDQVRRRGAVRQHRGIHHHHHLGGAEERKGAQVVEQGRKACRVAMHLDGQPFLSASALARRSAAGAASTRSPCTRYTGWGGIFSSAPFSRSAEQPVGHEEGFGSSRSARSQDSGPTQITASRSPISSVPPCSSSNSSSTEFHEPHPSQRSRQSACVAWQTWQRYWPRERRAGGCKPRTPRQPAHLAPALVRPAEHEMVRRRAADALAQALEDFQGLVVHLEAVVQPAEKELRQQPPVGLGDHAAQRLDRPARLFAFDEVVLDACRKTGLPVRRKPRAIRDRRASSSASSSASPSMMAAGMKRGARASKASKVAFAGSLVRPRDRPRRAGTRGRASRPPRARAPRPPARSGTGPRSAARARGRWRTAPRPGRRCGGGGARPGPSRGSRAPPGCGSRAPPRPRRGRRSPPPADRAARRSTDTAPRRAGGPPPPFRAARASAAPRRSAAGREVLRPGAHHLELLAARSHWPSLWKSTARRKLAWMLSASRPLRRSSRSARSRRTCSRAGWSGWAGSRAGRPPAGPPRAAPPSRGRAETADAGTR